jgi:hypothetical protein
MATTIRKNESVIDSWSTIVEQAAGREKELSDTIQKLVTEANMPDVSINRDTVTTGGIFSQKRDFLILAPDKFRIYRMLIGARSYGANLDVAWYLTRYGKIHRYAITQAFMRSETLFNQQDVRAFATVSHHCVLQAVKLLLEELEQDSSHLDTKSTGFLSVW